MAKKFLSIVLSLLLVFSTFAIVSIAGDTITEEDKALYPAEELAITDPKDRIDRCLLTGRSMGGAYIQDTAASKDILEDNLSYWKDEIIDEYHALEAKGDAATDEEWGALYRKMKTPHDNDFDSWADFWYEYKDLTKGQATVSFVASKEVVNPGDEFSVDINLTTDFWFNAMYATMFYDKNNFEFVGFGDLGEKFSRYAITVQSTNYGIYPVGGDVRSIEWPDAIKAEEGCYDTYGGINVGISKEAISSQVDPNVPSLICDNDKVVTFNFKAKDTAAAGSTFSFFCTNDAMYTLNKIDIYDEGDASGVWVIPCWQFYRCDKDSMSNDMMFADWMYQYDKSLSITGDEVTIAGQEVVPANYTALDAAIAEYDSSAYNLYTADSWAAYVEAVDAGKALSRDLTADEQAEVDAATQAIVDAKAALVLNKIVNAAVIGTPTIGASANVEVVANGSPLAIRFVGEGGENSFTFTREDATITTDGANEIWNVKVPVTAEKASYNVFGKWGGDYNDAGEALTIEAVEGLDLSIHSIEVPDMYGSMGGKIYLGVHDVIVRTSKDVYKIQFVDPDGNTRTFCSVDFPPVEEGEELVWTIPFKFSTLGNMNYALRTRAVNTTFALTGDYMTGRVVF